MPPITTMPTTLPKSSSNFSIDWLVNKSIDTTSDKISNNKHMEKNIRSELEVSKAIEISPIKLPSCDSDLNNSFSTRESLPRDSSYHFTLNSPIETDVKTDNKRKLEQLAASPTSDEQKFTRFSYDKPNIESVLLPSLEQQHQQQQQQHQQQQQQQHSQIISAQLQMAAAINYQRQQAAMAAAAAAAAAAASSTTGHHPQAFNFSQILSNNFQRTPYQMQPWLMNRYPRFPYGFSGEFLLHPYRKPKRIRTAFAPLQLLELENAFEGNQYVVGSERKALAKTLNLTETQVKVWFQNRRTKHKRMQQEGNGSSNRHFSDNDETSTMDERIDIEDINDYDDSH